MISQGNDYDLFERPNKILGKVKAVGWVIQNQFLIDFTYRGLDLLLIWL